MFNHFLNWFLQILIPYALLITAFLVLKAGRGQDRFEKAFDVGFDSCILGFGIAAVLLGGPDFQKILQTNAAPIIPLVVGFASIPIFDQLKKSKHAQPVQAAWSVVIGCLVFGANTALVTWLNERKTLPTIIWGIVAWVTPCVIYWLINR